MSRLEMKQMVRQALEADDLDAIVSQVRQHKRTLSPLIRLAYDKETLAGWRAIRAVGAAARVLVETNDGYEYLRSTVRKLLWSLSDESGGIGWSAPEMLGEIVSAAPGKFSDIIPLIAEVYTVEEDVFRAGIVYALSRIAEAAPERVTGYESVIILALKDREPLVKLNALGLFAILWPIVREKKLWSDEHCAVFKEAIQTLTNDTGVAWIYNNGQFIDIQVGEKAKKVLKNIEMK
jgi:hypothetical protein